MHSHGLQMYVHLFAYPIRPAAYTTIHLISKALGQTPQDGMAKDMITALNSKFKI